MVCSVYVLAYAGVSVNVSHAAIVLNAWLGWHTQQRICSDLEGLSEDIQ